MVLLRKCYRCLEAKDRHTAFVSDPWLCNTCVAPIPVKMVAPKHRRRVSVPNVPSPRREAAPVPPSASVPAAAASDLDRETTTDSVDFDTRKLSKRAQSSLGLAGTGARADPTLTAKARQELEELLPLSGTSEPNRGNLDDPTIEWRFEKPDYTLANLAYIKGKSRSHAAGSLPKLVEDLVKTWEMEGSHKEFENWTTIKQSEYWTQANGGHQFVGRESAETGNYNWLLDACPKNLYDNSKEDFESSHHIFRDAFPGGFAWELLDLFSGPPKVGFSWRHWGKFEGSFKGNQGHGETLDMYGFGLVAVDANLKILSIEIFYRPEPFLEAMQGTIPISALENGRGGFPDFFAAANVNSCPFADHHKAAVNPHIGNGEAVAPNGHGPAVAVH